MTDARKILSGAAWTYGAQVVTTVVQFAYAAFTARILGADDFGAYGVALAVAALIVLVSNGGLGQTAARMHTLEKARTRTLALYSLVLGTAGALTLYLTAELWAKLWDVPAAADPIRLLSLGALVAPWLGLGSGMLRRQGRFRALASVVLAANISGMVVGAAAVAWFQTPSSLLVSPLVAQIGAAVACCALNLRLVVGRGSLKSAKSDMSFSSQVLLVSLPSYANGNVGKWAVANALGAGALGQWNRADVVTTVPFAQLQAAMIQAVYPEFRHDQRDGLRARTVWADLLTLVAWVAFPTAAAAAVVLPHLVPVLFGPGWELAAVLAAPIAVAASLQLVAAVLASAIEALAKFRWIWLTQIVQLVIYGSAAAGVLVLHAWWPVIVGLFAGQIVQHLLHILLCWRSGYLSVWRVASGYGKAGLAAGAAAAVAWLAVVLFQALGIGAGIAVVLLASAGGAAVLWRFRGALPPVVILRRYGIA